VGVKAEIAVTSDISKGRLHIVLILMGALVSGGYLRLLNIPANKSAVLAPSSYCATPKNHRCIFFPISWLNPPSTDLDVPASLAKALRVVLNRNCSLDLFFGVAPANSSQAKTWLPHRQLSVRRDCPQDRVNYTSIALPQTPKLYLAQNR
jgi:hypothetical protein